jgi:hypothetical protein
VDSAEKQIKNQRERKARAAMKEAAVDRTTITYTEFLGKVSWNVASNSPHLTALLCEISASTLKREGILLSAVVVNADGERKGIPGSGFFEFAVDRGFEFDDERHFWDIEVKKVYAATTTD